MNNIIEFIKFAVYPNAGDTTFQGLIKEFLVAIVLFFAIWCLAELIQVIFSKISVFLSKKKKILGKITETIGNTLYRVVFIFAIYKGVSHLSITKSISEVLSNGVFVACVIIIFIAIHKIVMGIIENNTINDEQLFSSTIQPLIEKISSVLLGGVALVILLKHFNYDIVSLITAFGVSSLVIGLAAKDALANIISGFILLVDRPFSRGDRVKLTNGQVGDVISIGLRSTRFKSPDGSIITMPNTDLCNSMLINTRYNGSLSLGTTTLMLSQKNSVEFSKKIIEDIILRNEGLLKDPQPWVRVSSMTIRTYTLTIGFWVNDPADISRIIDEIMMEILKEFKLNNISFDSE